MLLKANVDWSRLLEKYIDAGLGLAGKIVVAFLMVIIGFKLIKLLITIIKTTLEKSEIDYGVISFSCSFIKIALRAVVIFMAVAHMGIEVSSFIAILGSAGVAVGLALQGSLSNFAGGVLILLLKPFVVGDYIIEDNHKNEGTVKEIQLFYTKLTTIDNKTIVIPNGMLTNNSLTNVTEKNERRLDLKIGISYDSDLRKAKDVIRRLLEEEERIKKDEEILIFVDELGASSVVLGVRAWVSTDEFWNVKWKLLEEIKLAMDAEGIEIPYQQVAVHMKEE